MSKLYLVPFLAFGLLFTESHYYGSTTAPVVIAGGIIKAKRTPDIVKKYKRKDCPVCRGTGIDSSGDGINKAECKYCEVETKIVQPQPSIKLITPLQQKIISQPNCVNGNCPIPSQKRVR